MSVQGTAPRQTRTVMAGAGGAAALLVALALTGCGSNDAAAPTAPVHDGAGGVTLTTAPLPPLSTTSQSTTSQSTTSSRGTSAWGKITITAGTTAGPASIVPPAAVRTAVRSGLVGFVTPSKNIGCYLDTESIRCDIARRSWTPPPTPADCELDWAQGISIGATGRAAFVCAGDTTLGAGPALAYGNAIRVGNMVCASLTNGVRCSNLKTGRGFSLAKESYSLS